MFRALICPSSGVCDYIVEPLHWPFRSWFAVCVWEFGCGLAEVVPGHHPSQTAPKLPQTQQTKNEMANALVQQYSCILLKMGILMPETC